MQAKQILTVDEVREIAAAAEAEANANNWAVTISIVDDGGHLLWLQRLDGAAPISTEIAPAKARTAALGRRDSKVYEDMINNGRVSFLIRAEPGRHAGRWRADHERRAVRRRGRSFRRKVVGRRANRQGRHRGARTCNTYWPAAPLRPVSFTFRRVREFAGKGVFRYTCTV